MGRLTDDQWAKARLLLDPVPPQDDLAVGGPDMDDEDADEVGTGTENLAVTSPSLTTKNPLKVDRNAAVEDMFGKQRQSLADLYDTAREKIRARYTSAMPGSGEMLLQLGAALLKPTENGRFMESLGNAAGALSQFGASKRTARNALEDKMLEVDLGQAKEMNDLQQRYLTALSKGQTSGLVYDPTRGVTVDKNNPGPTENWYQAPNGGPRLVLWQDDTWHAPPDENGLSARYKKVGEEFHLIDQVQEPY